MSPKVISISITKDRLLPNNMSGRAFPKSAVSLFLHYVSNGGTRLDLVSIRLIRIFVQSDA